MLFNKKMPEELARKRCSEKILKKQRVPFIKHLPPIEVEAETTRRTKDQVAKRAMALSLVAEKGANSPQKVIARMGEYLQIADELTHDESAFIKNKKTSDFDKNRFFWRYESLAVLLWALGFIDKLTRPEKEYDIVKLVEPMFRGSREEFLQAARLRSQKEILDAADLIYRYHWAVKNNEKNIGLNRSIVMERHYALNWLIGYMNQEWDEVSTDT